MIPDNRTLAPIFFSPWNKIMPAYDLPLDELQKYLPEREEPADFDSFWEDTLKDSQAYPINAMYKPIDFCLATLDTYDVTFAGWDGQSVKGWLILPKIAPRPLPCIVEFPSYGGGRGFPLDWLLFASAGYANFIMDNRGQGSGWRQGDTPDLFQQGYSPHSPGVMTLGITSPKTYFYRRLFVDAVRAVLTIAKNPRIDPDRIAVTGMSQGGAVSLAVGALVPTVCAVLPDVPFLSHFRRATMLVDTPPYNEINNYCQIHRDQVEQVFRTLSYFDSVNFAVRGRAPALFSVGLMDVIAPPSTVFAAYNWYAGRKDIKIWHFNGHEGGGTYHQIEKLKFLKKIFALETRN